MTAPRAQSQSGSSPAGSPVPALPAVQPVGRPARAPRFRLRESGWSPALRLTLCGLAVGSALAGGRIADRLTPAAGRPARREARRARIARRIAALLSELKGAYVKAGQFAALRYDALPAGARDAFAALEDRVVPLPFDAVRAMLEAELGTPLEARFAELDPTPLGTASIAQVHRARLRDGAEVAVKVQHPWLERSLPGDLALLGRLYEIWARVSAWRGRSTPRGVDRARLFAEFSAGLAEELDFAREAAMAGEIAANLAGDAQIVVPEVVPDCSTRRVLTMRYHPAVPILDRPRLDALGVRAADVLAVLARAYAKQVFVDGLFHADPHPGNLFVIDEPDAGSRPRVLFVDFGLSKRLAPPLRRELRLGIYALLQRDLDGFIAGMMRLGMIAPGAEPGARAAVARMFDRMSATGGSPLGLSGAGILGLKDEAKALLQETDGLQLPSDLLLYAKTLSYLFALGERLDPSVDLMKLTVPYLLRFLASHDG